MRSWLQVVQGVRRAPGRFGDRLLGRLGAKIAITPRPLPVPIWLSRNTVARLPDYWRQRKKFADERKKPGPGPM